MEYTNNYNLNKMDSNSYFKTKDFNDNWDNIDTKLKENADAVEEVKTKVTNDISELNSKMGGLHFGVDGDGNYGYYGADGSLVPFKKKPLKIINEKTSETYNCSGIAGYKNLTVDNFFVVAIKTGGKNWYKPVTVTKTYNSETGIFEFNAYTLVDSGQNGTWIYCDVYIVL